MLPRVRDRFQAPVFMKGMVCFSAKLPIFRQLKTVINVYDPALSVNISADEAGQVQCAPVHSGDDESSGGTRVPPDAVRRCTRFCLCSSRYHSLLNVGCPKKLLYCMVF